VGEGGQQSQMYVPLCCETFFFYLSLPSRLVWALKLLVGCEAAHFVVHINIWCFSGYFWDCSYHSSA
jgi:hypothetical protein